MGISQSCRNEMKNGEFLRYEIPIDILRSDAIGNVYDIFMYVKKQLKKSTLSKCESDLEKSLDTWFNYTSPNRSEKQKHTNEEKQEMKKMFNDELDKFIKTHPEHADKIPFGVFIGEDVRETFGNLREDEIFGMCPIKFTLIVVILIICAILVYMYRDKIFKR